MALLLTGRPMDSHSQVNKAISTTLRSYVYIKTTEKRRLLQFCLTTAHNIRFRENHVFLVFKDFFFVFHFRCLVIGEKYGSSSFRKKLKLARISVDTAGTYRIVARGKYCQFEKEVEVRVISKYYDNTLERFSLERRKQFLLVLLYYAL